LWPFQSSLWKIAYSHILGKNANYPQIRAPEMRTRRLIARAVPRRFWAISISATTPEELPLSYDLAFFANRQGMTLEDVRTAYRQACAGELPDEGADDATLSQFVAALESRYPQLSALRDDQIDESPWSCDFDLGARHLIVCMAFSKAEEAGAFILQLLSTHSLVLYDPQSDQAFLGDRTL
jgi:hypothetical protein